MSVNTFLHRHGFPLDSVKDSPYHNFIITGWHNPSFFGLVHLSYWYARINDFHVANSETLFAFGQIARGFGNQFAVSCILEQILDIGI
ncbi:hypothetical protein KCU98_g14184, partial [Aureobasidium melanogenum]